MDLKIILYTADTEKLFFELEHGIRPWGILLMISKGSFELVFPATGEQHLLQAGEIAYIPPKTEFFRHVLSPIDFHQFSFQYQSEAPGPSLSPGKLWIPPEQVRALCASADRLARLPRSEELTQHILTRILTEAYLFSDENPAASPVFSPEVYQTIQYMQEHLSERLELPTLSARVYLSHTGLIWKFKKELNTTPSDYLSALRIQRAKQLLLDTSLPIREIAEQCGYTNAYYFTNAFKHRTGVSPSRFRNDHFH